MAKQRGLRVDVTLNPGAVQELADLVAANSMTRMERLLWVLQSRELLTVAEREWILSAHDDETVEIDTEQWVGQGGGV